MQSRAVLEQARRLGVSQQTLETDLQVRKECVDRTFSALLQRLAREQQDSTTARRPAAVAAASKSKKKHSKKRSPPPINDNDDDMDDDFEDDEEEIDVERNSSDDNSDDLEAFSGMEDFTFSSDDSDDDGEGNSADERFPSKKQLKPAQKQPPRKDYAPEGRKQRGYHKLAGLFVCLLSTGEIGYVLRKPGGRLHLKLEANPQPVPSSADKLFVLSNQPQSASEAAALAEETIDEIVEVSRYVPQVKDLKIGQRVALLKFNNATGRISKLPQAKHIASGLGHVLVVLDASKEEKKTVVEMLRMVDDDHVEIAPSSWSAEKNATSGRPTKAVIARKPAVPAITALVPHSKRGEAWRRALKPVNFSDKLACANLESVLEEKNKVVIPPKPKPSTARKAIEEGGDTPKMTRGKKLCTTCNAIIGTASKSCVRCGAPCEKKQKL